MTKTNWNYKTNFYDGWKLYAQGKFLEDDEKAEKIKQALKAALKHKKFAIEYKGIEFRIFLKN